MTPAADIMTAEDLLNYLLKLRNTEKLSDLHIRIEVGDSHYDSGIRIEVGDR